MKYVSPLTDDEIVTLREMHRNHSSSRTRMRAHSLLLSHQGKSIATISQIYQVDCRSVSSWIDRWHADGLVGLYHQSGAGRPPILNAEEEAKVHHYLKQYPKDLKRVVHELEQDTHKRVSTKTIKRIIKKNAIVGNGFGSPPPRHQHLKNMPGVK